MVLASMLGAAAGSSADAFLVAFRVPNFLRRLFAEGAFSQSFVPVLAEYKTHRSEAEVRRLVSEMAGTLGVLLLLVTVLGILIAPLLVVVFAPGFLGHADKFELTVTLLRLTFPYILFISLAALAAGVLNSYGRFGIPAFTPVLLNFSLIGAALLVSPRLQEPAIGLAFGVLVAGVTQLVFQLPFVKGLGLLTWPRFGLGDAGVRRVLRLMLPAIFGVSVGQINLLLDMLLASFLVTGSISWLYYSDRLMEFPLGVFGIALATVILPSLARSHTRESVEEFSQTLDWALRAVWLIAAPAMLGLTLLAGPIIATLFQHGEFTATDTRMAARSLIAYALGLPGFILVKVLAPGFFARQDTRTPVRFALASMVSNLVLNLALVLPLAHAGLALATSLAAYVNAGLLLRSLRAHGAYRPARGWSRLVAQVLLACALMSSTLWLLAGPTEAWLAQATLERASHLLRVILGGGCAYLLALWLVGVRPESLRSPHPAPGRT